MTSYKSFIVNAANGPPLKRMGRNSPWNFNVPFLGGLSCGRFTKSTGSGGARSTPGGPLVVELPK